MDFVIQRSSGAMPVPGFRPLVPGQSEDAVDGWEAFGPQGAAHDVLEHEITGPWTLQEELMAMGAMMAVRGPTNYFRDRFPGAWQPERVLRHNLMALADIVGTEGISNLPIPRRVKKAPAEIEDWFSSATHGLGTYGGFRAARRMKAVRTWLRKGVHRAEQRWGSFLPLMGDVFLQLEIWFRSQQVDAAIGGRVSVAVQVATDSCIFTLTDWEGRKTFLELE